MLELQRI